MAEQEIRSELKRLEGIINAQQATATQQQQEIAIAVNLFTQLRRRLKPATWRNAGVSTDTCHNCGKSGYDKKDCGAKGGGQGNYSKEEEKKDRRAVVGNRTKVSSD